MKNAHFCCCFAAGSTRHGSSTRVPSNARRAASAKGGDTRAWQNISRSPMELDTPIRTMVDIGKFMEFPHRFDRFGGVFYIRTMGMPDLYLILCCMFTSLPLFTGYQYVWISLWRNDYFLMAVISQQISRFRHQACGGCGWRKNGRKSSIIMNLYNHLISWRVPVRFILKLNWNKHTHLYSGINTFITSKVGESGYSSIDYIGIYINTNRVDTLQQQDLGHGLHQTLNDARNSHFQHQAPMSRVVMWQYPSHPQQSWRSEMLLESKYLMWYILNRGFVDGF